MRTATLLGISTYELELYALVSIPVLNGARVEKLSGELVLASYDMEPTDNLRRIKAGNESFWFPLAIPEMLDNYLRQPGLNANAHLRHFRDYQLPAPHVSDRWP